MCSNNFRLCYVYFEFPDFRSSPCISVKIPVHCESEEIVTSYVDEIRSRFMDTGDWDLWPVF